MHFDENIIAGYLPEFARVLRPGGKALVHHSNRIGDPGRDFRKNPHWRNSMSAELFCDLATREGLAVLEQQVIDWFEVPKLDCVSVLQRRG